MKILLVQESDWLTRNPHQHHHLADRLAVRGHEIRVIDYEIGWSEKKSVGLFSRRQVFRGVHKVLPEARVTVIRPGIVKLPLVSYISLFFTHRAEIQKQIREFQPDLIFGFSILNSYLAASTAKKLCLPFFYYWLDALDTLLPAAVLRPIAVALEERTLQQADAIIVINEKLRDTVVKHGANPKRIRVQRPGLDLEKFVPGRAREETRARYGFNERDVVLFFMGWLYHFSGMKEVCLQMAKHRDSGFKLLIVGDGDAFGDLRQIVQTHGLADRVILTGKKPYDEIPSYIAASDICLLPAYDNEIMSETVPIKMYEYMAMAKPVIATRLTGLVREFGEDSGVVFVRGPQAAVAGAEELLRSGNVEAEGRKARAFAEKFDWGKVTDELEKLMEQAIKRKQMADRI